MNSFLSSLKKSWLGSLIKRTRSLVVLGKWYRATRQPSLTREQKYQALLAYARRFGLTALVETGTYLGDTMETLRGEFSELYSIELDHALWERATRRFEGDSHIHILEGDSQQVLPGILRSVTQPTLFWLDGHYSEGFTAKGEKDTPIMEELSHIFHSGLGRYVILIDDARLFVGLHDYPTVGEVENLVRASHPSWVFEVADDIIRIYPAK